MNINQTIMIIAMSLFNAFAISYAAPIQTYKSPNNQLMARVMSHVTTEESVLDIMTLANGSIISHQDYTSADGEHGLLIEQAAWTPDSQFFIFTTTSSGGHSSWQSPSYFYRVKDRKLYSFSDFFPAIANTDFTVAKPDLLTITIWTPFTAGKGMDESVALKVTFHMADLLPAK